MRYLFTLLLLCCSVTAHAAFPATAATLYRYQNGSYSSGASYAPKQTACNNFAASWTALESFHRPSYGVVTAGNGCEVRITATGALGVAAGPITQAGYVCPANALLSGSSCTCESGYLEQSNTCVAEPPPSCPAGTSGGGYYFTVPPGGTMPQYAQQDGSRCVVQYYNDLCTLGPDGTRYCHAQTKLTGDYCPSTGCTGTGDAPGSPSPTPPEDTKSDTSGPCQPGYYYGTVNGQDVCVPGHGSSSSDTKEITKTNPDGTASDKKTTTVTSTGTTENGTKQTQTTQTTLETQWEAAQKTTFSGPPSVPATVQIPTATGETKTTTVTNPDGSITKYDVKKNADGTTDVTTTDGKVVEKTDTTTCTGTKCTTDQTTKENGTTTGTTKGEITLDGLCKESPDHAACGTDKESAFGGTCSAGFNCDGDAIQCAMARKQHETVCALFENKSAESDLYDAEKAKTGNVTDANPNNSTQSIGSGMFDFTSALGGGSCIPNKSVTVWGKSIDLPFSDICPWLNALGTVLVSVSSLVALRIVMRG